jgi:hypothetical protein
MNRTRTLEQLLQERDSIEIDRFVDIARLIGHCERLERAIAEARAREAKDLGLQRGFE